MSESDDLEKELIGKTIPNKPSIRWDRMLGFIIILLFFGIFGGWAVISPLESASVTQGKVIVAGYRKVVQHLEGGIIKKIYVKNGSVVDKGEPLIELDNTQAKVTLDVVQNEFFELSLVAARVRAELQLDRSFNFPKELEEYRDNPKVKKLFASQAKIFKTNVESYNTRVKILQQRISQLQEQKKGELAQLRSTQRQQKIIIGELKETKALYDKRLIERAQLISLIREEARLDGVRGASVSSIATIEQKIGETQTQLIGINESRHSDLLKELKEANSKLAQLIEREKVAKYILARTIIRAPQAGTVVDLKVHTVGGVVKPGENLMEIVPAHQNLIIETEVKLQDIDIVKAGLMAKVQLTAFQTRTTPMLIGKVTHVSADTYEDPRTGRTYYKAFVSISPKELKKLGDQKLYPGMPAQVMIITQKLTPFEYFITPIQRSFSRAFREQ